MPEPNKDLYHQKLNRIDDAVRLKMPDRVPIILEFGCFAARYAVFWTSSNTSHRRAREK